MSCPLPAQVCPTSFSMRAAMVACRQLGLPYTGAAYFTAAIFGRRAHGGEEQAGSAALHTCVQKGWPADPWEEHACAAAS